MLVLPIGVFGRFWAAAFVQQVASPNRQFLILMCKNILFFAKNQNQIIFLYAITIKTNNIDKNNPNNTIKYYSDNNGGKFRN